MSVQLSHVKENYCPYPNLPGVIKNSPVVPKGFITLYVVTKCHAAGSPWEDASIFPASIVVLQQKLLLERILWHLKQVYLTYFPTITTLSVFAPHSTCLLSLHIFRKDKPLKVTPVPDNSPTH